MQGAVSFDKYLIQRLEANAAFRKAHLKEALNEKDRELRSLMLRQVAEAMGGSHDYQD